MNRKEIYQPGVRFWTPLALLSAVSLLGCVVESTDEASFEDDSSVASKSQELIGGSQAAPYHFRSTVWLGIPNKGSCTGAKVGPRHFLTAAHCIADDTGQLAFNVGDTLKVTNDILLAGANERSLTISRAEIHPSYTEKCNGDCRAGQVLHRESPADIAVIIVDSDTNDIPQARVEMGDIADGTDVVKTGYGCEDSVTAQGPSTRYKTDVSKTYSSDIIQGWYWSEPENPLWAYRLPDASYTDRVGASYLVTTGRGDSSSEASLCPGDSGGPLYLNNNSDPRVVGVNAYYVFQFLGVSSMRDVHTRTSLRSRHNVGLWLHDLGVDTVGGDQFEGEGEVTVERWENVPGRQTTDIPVNDPPDFTWRASSFELPTVDWGDNFGIRMRGYLTAPASGDYTFWIAGDDYVRLYISPDANAANKNLIAFHNDYSGLRQWDKFTSQKSGVITLVAGGRYYIEALMKEGGGGDHLSVGWTQPGQTNDGPYQVIPGTQLSAMDPSHECTCDIGCNTRRNPRSPIEINGYQDGCYFFYQGMGRYLYSSNTDKVEINGQNYTNQFLWSSGYPSELDDGHYVYIKSRSLSSAFKVRN